MSVFYFLAHLLNLWYTKIVYFISGEIIMTDYGLVSLINEYLSKQYKNYKGAYFFGSRAFNTNKTDSDLDIVMLFENINLEQRFPIYGLLGNLEYENNVLIDQKIMTMAEFEANPYFYNEVTGKGKYYAPVQ